MEQEKIYVTKSHDRKLIRDMNLFLPVIIFLIENTTYTNPGFILNLETMTLIFWLLGVYLREKNTFM